MRIENSTGFLTIIGSQTRSLMHILSVVTRTVLQENKQGDYEATGKLPNLS